MVVQHNMQAMNSNRMLGITTGAQAKATEKLSSGYKINRAADDAAGLSISEKMRKQINGLDRASTNAEDGVSAVQTAEGALTEVHSMLQRMNELAVQAANGTNSEDDREAIQNEIDQLTTEIDRVAETTKFNETYLLKGEAAGGTKTEYVAAHDAGLKGKLGASADGKTTFTLDKALKDGDKVTIAGKEYTIGSKTASTDGYAKLTDLNNKKVSVGDSFTDESAGKTYTLVDKVANATSAYGTGDTIEINGTKYTIAATTNITGGQLSAADANTEAAKALNAGQKVYITSKKAATGMYAANATTKVEVVASLGTEEISSLGITVATAGTVLGSELANAAGGATVAKGDVFTINGESTTATDEDPVALETIKDVVKQMQKDDQFSIGGTALTITIADKTDVGAGEYTVNDALTLLNEGDEVQFKGTNVSDEMAAALQNAGLKTGADYSAVVSKTVSDDENVLTVKDAYAMMAEELAKASSIGTDAGKGATVKSNNSGTFTITQGTVETKKALNFSLHVGADADMTNKISVGIDSMDAASLGIKGLNIKDDTGVAATYAIDAIADAVIKVSAQRSALGAVQNRLEHTIANLDNVVENTTSAESRIRDTDMAEEMVEYSKNNILAQAGQSMLAQANQSTQGVLSLLG